VSVLVVGLSHKTAPVATLERAAISGDTLGKLLRDVSYLPDVAEAFVVSTCNRVEVYAEVDRFHAGVNGICDLLARHSGIAAGDLTPNLYVHYEDAAVRHLLNVSSGLDSMVVGEDQILGQVRTAIKLATDHGTMGRTLGDLGRVALRAGKRARAETGIDRLGASLVSVGLELALPQKQERDATLLLDGMTVLVVGAGSMSGLAVATAARSGAANIVVANRTRKRAERLAAGVGGTVADLNALEEAMAQADLVISCTGAAGVVITADQVRAAVSAREASVTAGKAPLALLDLAMPRDVESAVAGLENVRLIDMAAIGVHASAHTSSGDVPAVRAIVDEEFDAYLSAWHAAQVAPTVTALRAKAAQVVDVELARLSGRLSGAGLNGHAMEEIAQTVHRVVDKLLHAPTVRVKELAGSPGGEDYAAALRVLFDLNPRTVDAVTAVPTAAPPVPDQEG
jgi:glutamyl-tRNA reductase